MSANILERYEKLDFLAETPTGSAYKGLDNSFKRNILLKTIPKKNRDIIKRFRNYISVAGQIIHPNVLTTLDYGEDEENFYTVQEFVDITNSSLTIDKTKHMEDSDKISILSDLIDSLQFAYDTNIIHKNLYFDSIFFASSLKVKIDYFNLDRILTKTELVSELGYTSAPPPTMPPEKLKGKNATYLSDFFQLGCIAFTLFTGLHPFGNQINDTSIKKIKKLDHPEIGVFADIPDNVKKAIGLCLKSEPAQRTNSYDELMGLLHKTKHTSSSKSKEPYKILEHDGRLYLIVNDQNLSADIIESALIKEGYLNFSIDQIKNAIRFSNGSPYLILEKVKKVDTAKLENITLSVTRSRMEAYLDTPRDIEITKEELVYFLKMNKVVFGIDESAVKKFCETPRSDIPVAHGKAPVNGSDAFIIYYFETENVLKPKKTDSATDQVDFKETSFIQPVRKNDVLCLKVPYTEGIEGTDVFGVAIKPKPGKDRDLPVGKNTYVSSDRSKLLSTVDGQITFSGKNVNVLEVIIINHDVDYSIGNVRYHGDVIIKGDVPSGFEVAAGGDVKIYGIVEGCNVTSDRGSILIKNGIFGKEKAVIKALKSIKSEFIQDTTVNCNGDVEVIDYVRNSNIRCGGSFKCSKKTGTVHTSTINAADYIEVNIAGTTPYTKTIFSITPLHQKIINNNISSFTKKNDEYRSSLSFIKEKLKKIIIKYGNIEDALMDKEYKLYVDRLKDNEDKIRYTNEHIDILQQLLERTEDHIPYVKFNQKVYTDVTIRIGNYTIKTSKDFEKGAVIKLEENILKAPEDLY